MGKGILWISIGIVMVVFDIVVTPVFSIPITADFSFPIAVLAVLYGILSIVSARIAVDHAQLTEDEVADWGEQLEQATPQIIALSEQQWSSEAIAKEVEKSTQIPEVVLIKYMYAIRGYLKDVSADKNAQERRGIS